MSPVGICCPPLTPCGHPEVSNPVKKNSIVAVWLDTVRVDTFLIFPIAGHRWMPDRFERCITQSQPDVTRAGLGGLVRDGLCFESRELTCCKGCLLAFPSADCKAELDAGTWPQRDLNAVFAGDWLLTGKGSRTRSLAGRDFRVRYNCLQTSARLAEPPLSLNPNSIFFSNGGLSKHWHASRSDLCATLYAVLPT